MARTCRNILLTIGMLFGTASVASATIIGFANSAGNNSKVPADLGSNASADGVAFTVSNGATPNIGVNFVNPTWDYHHSANFDVIENFTAGGIWDTDGGPDIAQVENNGASVVFSADAGFALVLNAFDFGLSRETLNQGNDWTFTLIDSSDAIVWSESVSLLNSGSGDIRTITPGFTGAFGASYTLKFDMTAESGGTFGTGRNALDNLSFNQVAVPEPASLALVGCAFFGLLARRRRSSLGA